MRILTRTKTMKSGYKSNQKRLNPIWMLGEQDWYNPSSIEGRGGSWLNVSLKQGLIRKKSSRLQVNLLFNKSSHLDFAPINKINPINKWLTDSGLTSGFFKDSKARNKFHSPFYGENRSM